MFTDRPRVPTVSRTSGWPSAFAAAGVATAGTRPPARPASAPAGNAGPGVAAISAAYCRGCTTTTETRVPSD